MEHVIIPVLLITAIVLMTMFGYFLVINKEF